MDERSESTCDTNFIQRLAQTLPGTLHASGHFPKLMGQFLVPGVQDGHLEYQSANGHCQGNQGEPLHPVALFVVKVH